MQNHRVLFLLYALLAILLNESNGVEEQAECKDKSNLQVLGRCCNIPNEELLSEEEKAVGTMCDKTVYGDRLTSPTTEEEQLELYECMDECFYNGTHLLTADMKLNETALIAEYDVSTENFSHWKEPITKAVKSCLEKNVVSEVKPNAKCKSGSYQFSQCFGLKLYLYCPPEDWKVKDEGCNKAREVLMNC
uniref:Odorant-binding protein 13 n=1 Tax=Halyomorpha halys TaxID=286706 RepID=A0A1L2JGQ2_HALHY|nr:odorant-binding protein 13 [Halyomorpha halys]